MPESKPKFPKVGTRTVLGAEISSFLRSHPQLGDVK